MTPPNKRMELTKSALTAGTAAFAGIREMALFLRAMALRWMRVSEKVQEGSR
jgi:hypothetical protein